jgi:hypothetical protein
MLVLLTLLVLCIVAKNVLRSDVDGGLPVVPDAIFKAFGFH